ncbi:hypothetical protein DL98DRAFT_539157 [Cadophora sp. DSE1049]|nr:hypothetical protein DL98DRAFT_539157 [Cadophora sp. DSE1049]
MEKKVKSTQVWSTGRLQARNPFETRKATNTSLMAEPKQRRAIATPDIRPSSHKTARYPTKGSRTMSPTETSRPISSNDNLPPIQALESNASMHSRSKASTNPPIESAKTSDSRFSFNLASEEQITTLYKSLAPPVTDQPSLLADVPVDFEKFTSFPKLPAEIRLKIWRSALCSTSNIIKVDLEASPHFVVTQTFKNRRGREDQLRGLTKDVNYVMCKFDLNSKDGPNGALLGVCVESRSEALKILAHYDYIQLRDNSLRHVMCQILPVYGMYTNILAICSKKIWFNPETDTFYFDQQAILAFSIMANWHPVPSAALCTAQKIKTIGVDQFSLGTRGVQTLLEQFFKRARCVVPIEVINGKQDMHSSMSGDGYRRTFKEPVVTPFVESFRAMVEQHSEFDESKWGLALQRACNGITWMDYLLKKSLSWIANHGERYRVGQKVTYSQ